MRKYKFPNSYDNWGEKEAREMSHLRRIWRERCFYTALILLDVIIFLLKGFFSALFYLPVIFLFLAIIFINIDKKEYHIIL